MKISELPVAERTYYRTIREQTELVVGGYENIIQDGGTTEAPTAEMVAREAMAEVEIEIKNSRDAHAHFIGKERMVALATAAAKRSLKDSMFAE